MLAVQVQYWNLQENSRHNKATEEETHRSNLAVETETHRHNVETERLGWSTLAETVRHNQATEDLGRRQLEEQAKHNREVEAQGWMNLDISKFIAQTGRYDAETRRMSYEANVQKISNDYSLGLMAQETAAKNADINNQRMVNDAAIGWFSSQNENNIRRDELGIRRQELDERIRHQKQSESIETAGLWMNLLNNMIQTGVKLGVAAAAGPF